MSVPKEIAKILPHTKAKGIDVCAGDGYIFIIRSDLNCYMKCLKNMNYEPDYKEQAFGVYPLHPGCSGGDHYLIGPDSFIIIKGDSFFKVADLSTPKLLPIALTKLSEQCKGGENYLYNGQNFVIIKNSTLRCLT